MFIHLSRVRLIYNDDLPSRADAANQADDRAALADSRPCPVCRQAIGTIHFHPYSLVSISNGQKDKMRVYNTSAFEPTEPELEQLQAFANTRDRSSSPGEDPSLDTFFKSRDVKGKGKAKAEPEEDLKLEDLVVDEEEMEPSSKMIKMVSNPQYHFCIPAHIFLVSTSCSWNLSKRG